MTAEHKVLNEGRESRDNHRYAAVVQVHATQQNPCQTKTSQETEKNFTKVFQSRHRSQKLFIRTIYWNLAGLVKNHHGIIEQLHFIDQRQAELQNELYVEEKRHQPYYRNLDRMKSGSGICEMLLLSAGSKIWEILPGHVLFAEGIWEEDILTAIEELENLAASETYPRRLNAKEILITQKDGEFIYSVADGSSKIFRKRLRIPRTHSDLIHRHLVEPRSSNIRAEKRIISYSTELY